MNPLQAKLMNNQNKRTPNNSVRSRFSSKIFSKSPESNLNYYSKYSPNRKKGQFQDFVGHATSPLTTPRKAKLRSSRNIRHCNCQSSRLQKPEASSPLGNFNLVEPDQLLLQASLNRVRKENIFIDSEQEVKESVDRDSSAKIPIESHDKNRKPSSSGSSSFERMVERSESQQSPYIQTEQSDQNRMTASEQYQRFPIKAAHGNSDILIFDDDDEVNAHVSYQNREDDFPINVITHANTVSTERHQQEFSDDARNIKSEDASFSLESDLSAIEQKWNSYFDEDESNKSISNGFLDGNHYASQKQGEEQSEKREEEDLPSFSRQVSSGHDIPDSDWIGQQQISHEKPSQVEEVKELNRHFTFASALDIAIETNEESNSINQKTLFKNLFSSKIVENIIKKERMLQKEQTSQKTATGKKQPNQIFKQSFKAGVKKQRSSKNNISSFLSNSISDKEAHSLSFQMSRISKKNSEKTEATQFQTEAVPSAKQIEKSRKRQLWQQTIKRMLERQKREKKRAQQMLEQKNKTAAKNQKAVVENGSSNFVEKDFQNKQTPQVQETKESQHSYTNIYKQNSLKVRKGSYGDGTSNVDQIVSLKTQSQKSQESQNEIQSSKVSEAKQSLTTENTERSVQALKIENEKAEQILSKQNDLMRGNEILIEEVENSNLEQSEAQDQTKEQQIFKEQVQENQQVEKVKYQQKSPSKTSRTAFVSVVKQSFQELSIPDRQFLITINSLQEVIELLPQKLKPTYQKIYRQLFWQSMQYQGRLEQQSYQLQTLKTLKFLRQKGVDGEKYLTSEQVDSEKEFINLNSHEGTESVLYRQKQQRQQVFLNQLLILSLVRKISKQV